MLVLWLAGYKWSPVSIYIMIPQEVSTWTWIDSREVGVNAHKYFYISLSIELHELPIRSAWKTDLIENPAWKGPSIKQVENSNAKASKNGGASSANSIWRAREVTLDHWNMLTIFCRI